MERTEARHLGKSLMHWYRKEAYGNRHEEHYRTRQAALRQLLADSERCERLEGAIKNLKASILAAPVDHTDMESTWRGVERLCDSVKSFFRELAALEVPDGD